MIDRVAFRLHDRVVSLPRPARHSALVAILAVTDPDLLVQPNQQGFLTDSGEFVDRKQAKQIAVTTGQVLPDGRDELFSEDLWSSHPENP